jgi:hypothetical protein
VGHCHQRTLLVCAHFHGAQLCLGGPA